MSEEYQREYLGRPVLESPEEKRLHELASEYHERTERYDRTICTGPIVRGSIMPATPDQMSAINAHARAVRDELLVEVRKLGFDRAQWQAAIARAKP